MLYGTTQTTEGEAMNGGTVILWTIAFDIAVILGAAWLGWL